MHEYQCKTPPTSIQNTAGGSFPSEGRNSLVSKTIQKRTGHIVQEKRVPLLLYRPFPMSSMVVVGRKTLTYYKKWWSRHFTAKVTCRIIICKRCAALSQRLSHTSYLPFLCFPLAAAAVAVVVALSSTGETGSPLRRT